MLSTLSIVQYILQETKHRDNVSHSTSNNSSQEQEFNLPDVLVRQSELKIIIAESKWSLAYKIHNFASSSGTFWKISLPINVTGSKLKFVEHSFFAKNVAKSC